MANVLFSDLTVPTPEPYDSKNPERQRENFFYALNQVLGELKAASAEISINIFVPEISTSVALSAPGIEEAIRDLKYEGILLDLGNIKVIRTGKTGSVIQT